MRWVLLSWRLIEMWPVLLLHCAGGRGRCRWPRPALLGRQQHASSAGPHSTAHIARATMQV